MSSNGAPGNVPPFPPEYRASGLLMHVTSLPSPYGIGDLGSSAFSWVDRLHDAGQGWWQALPLGPTGYGNSPYQAMSSFAGNAMLISPGSLISDGLLKATDCEADVPRRRRSTTRPSSPSRFASWKRRGPTSEPASAKTCVLPSSEFCAQQEHWLEDYALFRALKARYNGAYYLDWPAELVQREPKPLWPVRGASWRAKLIRSALRNFCCSARAISLSNTRMPKACG